MGALPYGNNEITSNNIHLEPRCFGFNCSTEAPKLIGGVSTYVIFALHWRLNVIVPKRSALDFGLDRLTFGRERNCARVIDC